MQYKSILNWPMNQQYSLINKESQLINVTKVGQYALHYKPSFCTKHWCLFKLDMSKGVYHELSKKWRTNIYLYALILFVFAKCQQLKK